jgi:hypothetical protein
MFGDDVERQVPRRVPGILPRVAGEVYSRAVRERFAETLISDPPASGG